MMRRVSLALALLSSLCAAGEAPATPEQAWGMASALRSATVPYATTHDDPLLNSYVLLLYLETPHLYLDGTEGGIRLYRDHHWEAALYGAMHFVDMPRHDAHYFNDDTADLGVTAGYRAGRFHTDLLLLSDPAWRLHAKLRLGAEWKRGPWSWRPYAAIEYKSAAYNRCYFGRNRVRLGADAGAEAGIRTRLYVTENIALLADAGGRYLGPAAAASDTTDSAFQGELYLGAGIFGGVKRPRVPFRPSGYLRFAYGSATRSSFSETVSGKGTAEFHGQHMVSLFYGLPLSDTLFGAGIRSYFTPGFVHHFASGPQASTQEYAAAFKFYYRPSGRWLRSGFGCGLSYINHPTYVEHYINTKDGYDHTSRLMNFLDISFDFELKQLFGKKGERFWFGYGLHHRSGVFRSAHQYGQIKGGSNYNTLYLQYHFTE